jgi:hypothetical protein
MRIFVLLYVGALIAVAFPALSQNFLCTNRSTASGGFDLSCSPAQPTQPTAPRPTEPTMPRQPAPIPASCAFPHEKRTLGQPGTIQRGFYGGGVTYSFPLRQIRSQGGFEYSATTGSPSIRVEVSISKCPGDWNTAMTTGVAGSRGAVATPCYFATNHEGIIRWSPVGDLHLCPVPQGETWFLNWRFAEDSPLMDYRVIEN